MFGLISGNAEQWEQSVTTFTKLTKSNGRNGNAWHGLGWSLARLNRDSEALGPLQRSIQLGPQNADAYRELGDSYFKLHRFNEAVEQFQQYIKLKPNDPAGHHSLGMAYCELGEFGSAVEPISRALALGPEFAQLERVEDAKDILTRAGTVNSGDSKLHHSFGELYLKLGMRDEAYREHEVLLLLDPSLADALAKLLDAPPNS
jgi:tetratricopeptide (TPR) repeat protein